MKTALLLALGLTASAAFAQTIKCDDIGEIYVDGDQILLSYNDKLGFSDKTDQGYLINAGEERAIYQVSKWGATLTIPVPLLDSKSCGNITISLPETSDQTVSCTAE